MTTTPDLSSYDLIIVNTSAGKDSQAMMTHLVALADEQGVSRDKFLAVHCDLGRVEWAGTLELAQEQAEHYGLRFVAVSRPQGDLLEAVVQRRESNLRKAEQAEAEGDLEEAERRRNIPSFPSSENRYCTSDQKTGQVVKVMTAEVKRLKAEGHVGRVRILNTLGIRAEESAARAQKQSFHKDSATNKTMRDVDRWLPIFDWSEEKVWDTIWESGVRFHEAYNLGMPRLSCVFCVLAGEAELVIAAQHNPALAQEYIRVEQEVGSNFFTDGRSISEIVAKAQEQSRALRAGLAA